MMHDDRTKPFVLDTSAMYNGTDYPADTVLYSTPMVVDEVKRVYRSNRAELFVDTRLKIIEPDRRSVGKVVEAARKNGDIARMSPADIEVLSLAYELNAVIITEDYSIQNTASALGVEFRSLYIPRIASYVEWTLICESCRRESDSKEEKVCRICGGKMITVRKKSRPIADSGSGQ
jgi:UPF0271 protein